VRCVNCAFFFILSAVSFAVVFLYLPVVRPIVVGVLAHLLMILRSVDVTTYSINSFSVIRRCFI
jgi:hypothetical protein